MNASGGIKKALWIEETVLNIRNITDHSLNANISTSLVDKVPGDRSQAFNLHTICHPTKIKISL
jgi:hypothetical protein